MLEGRNIGLGVPPPPEYGAQPQVTERVMEAWHWLVTEGLLLPDHTAAGWHTISTNGRQRLIQQAQFNHWESLGVDQVRSDLEHAGGTRIVGGTQENVQLAWQWVCKKQDEASLSAVTRSGKSRGLPLIAGSRIEELRNLPSTRFDLRKLVRICEELNISFEHDCFWEDLVCRGCQ